MHPGAKPCLQQLILTVGDGGSRFGSIDKIESIDGSYFSYARTLHDFTAIRTVR
jgi:hypothetical protein